MILDYMITIMVPVVTIRSTDEWRLKMDKREKTLSAPGNSLWNMIDRYGVSFAKQTNPKSNQSLRECF